MDSKHDTARDWLIAGARQMIDVDEYDTDERFEAAFDTLLKEEALETAGST